jgi:GTP cyclohydrolase I
MSDYKLSADSVGSGVDQERVKKAVREILFAIGEDPDRPGLVETPDRVARMYEEIFAGLHNDVRDSIKVFNEPDNDEMILVGDIPFYSMCEHHLLPLSVVPT